MPKTSIDLDAIARQVEATFARNRALYGDLRMEANDDGGDSGGGTGDGGEQKSLEDVIKDLNLTPEQIAGRLEASKKWEQRAKSSDRVDRQDYDRVMQELDTLKQAHETEQEKAVREAREAGKAEGAQANALGAAKVMLRMAIKARKQDITDDELTELVDETNLSAFVSENGVDEDKILRRASRAVGTTAGSPAGPDMGQGNRGGSRGTPGAGGNAEADKRFGKTA